MKILASSPITSWQIDGERMETESLFAWSPKKKKKKQRHYFANNGPSNQGYGFSSGHVWM